MVQLTVDANGPLVEPEQLPVDLKPRSLVALVQIVLHLAPEGSKRELTRLHQQVLLLVTEQTRR